MEYSTIRMKQSRVKMKQSRGKFHVSASKKQNISGSQQWIYRDLIVPLIYHGGETSRGETNRAHSERTTLDDVLIAVIYFAREVTRYQAICILDREHRNGCEKRLECYIDYEGQRIKEDRNSVEKLVNENKINFLEKGMKNKYMKEFLTSNNLI